jgi:hypothetical protein
MATIEATESFASQIASSSKTLECGLKPDVDNGKCADFRRSLDLSTAKRPASEYAMAALLGVPLICIHCQGVSQKRWNSSDIITKGEI